MKTITLILLIILNITLILRLKYERKAHNERQVNETWKNEEIAYSLYKGYIYENQNVYVDNISTNHLDSVIDINYKLFFKIPISYCDGCVRPMIEELKLLSKNIDNRKIVIITSFPTIEELNNFKSEMDINNLTIVNALDNDFTLNTKDLIGAYLFILNTNFRAKQVFFCSKFNSFCYTSYLKAITPYLVE